ncbi:MAG: hypothetical protein RLZZ628_2059 [Bacteroidota bacterium]|jgi:hypothetical protein
MFHSVRKASYTFGYIGIQMDVRISQISRIRTDFFGIHAQNPSKKTKKIRINP